MSDASSKIRFEVETGRILEILSREIYDSPHALLRENVQNAYDAILMRSALEETGLEDRAITITLDGTKLTVQDDGVGMDEAVLRENFWKAGSSGKRSSALAQRAGVIGTFGIGAMANFGVCSELVVSTRHMESSETIVSRARRAQLKIAEDCIDVERVADGRGPGTIIEAVLDEGAALSVEQVKDYLAGYVRYLPVKVTVNGQLVSRQSFESALSKAASEYEQVAKTSVSRGRYAGRLQLSVNASSQVLAWLRDIEMDGAPVQGEVFLFQGGKRTMGYRNLFGLAPVPISSQYELGGAVNLKVLQPTAGREALSRESIQLVAELVWMLEEGITVELAKTAHADRNACFLHYIASKNLTKLAGMVTVQVLPAKVNLPLSGVKSYEPGKNRLTYAGRDAAIIQRFATEQSNLLHISQAGPRRKLQARYLQSLGIEQVPDHVLVEPLPSTSLAIDCAMVLLRVQRILVDDYLMANAELVLASISHGVEVHVEESADGVQIAINKDMPSFQMIVQSYDTARDVFDGIAKDFVREHLYPHVRDHIPSSTRQGRDALLKRLRQNKELFQYEESDLGDMEAVMADYLSGKKSLGEVLLSPGSRSGGSQRQKVNPSQVGAVEDEIPDIVDDAGEAQVAPDGSAPSPPIMRVAVRSEKKVLSVGSHHPKLNNFRLFLSMSDRLYRLEGDFLRLPHTTRVMWGAHRVIYVFTDATGSLSLYYDIELLDPLDTQETGGRMLPTTTIVTGTRVYVPVPSELEPAFSIDSGEKSFYVRFDTIP